MSIHYKGVMIIIPSIVTTIFLGAFWKRFNSKAACTAMIAGSVLTVITVFYPDMINPLTNFVKGPVNGKYIYMRALFGMSITAIIGVIVTLFTKPDDEEKINGLTVDTLDYAMEKYKGGKPNHAVGKPVKHIDVVLDESIPAGKISVSKAAMETLKANEDDLLYITDARWILGGLRSMHVKAHKAHDDGNKVILSKATFEEAMLLEGKQATVEKIM